MDVTLDTIQRARERIGSAIYRSPCPYSLTLSRLCGCEIYCKLDHLQMTGSFKERGACNKLLSLDEPQRRRGVIAASAGNHALGLAYHGRRLGVPVTVVMPRWAPPIKVDNCRQLDAEVVLHGETFEDARKHANELAGPRGLLYISGFDDPHIIAGQGTIGLEILEDEPDVQTIVVPVGGGGLVAGIALAVKAMRPEVRIVGVEPANAPTMHAALEEGEPVPVEVRPTLADGLAVARVGKLCLEISRRVVDQWVLVDEAQIAQSVLRLMEMEKAVVEGAGATALAAVLSGKTNVAGQKVVLVLSGGNIDLAMIGRVIDRGLAADGRLCRIVAHVSDRPGGLAHLTAVLAATGASIKHVSHDRYFAAADVALVSVGCVLETRDFAHIEEVAAALRQAGIGFSMPVMTLLEE
jgi:threonine dehydratase